MANTNEGRGGQPPKTLFQLGRQGAEAGADESEEVEAVAEVEAADVEAADVESVDDDLLLDDMASEELQFACGVCGALLPSAAAFCGECGTPVATEFYDEEAPAAEADLPTAPDEETHVAGAAVAGAAAGAAVAGAGDVPEATLYADPTVAEPLPPEPEGTFGASAPIEGGATDTEPEVVDAEPEVADAEGVGAVGGAVAGGVAAGAVVGAAAGAAATPAMTDPTTVTPVTSGAAMPPPGTGTTPPGEGGGGGKGALIAVVVVVVVLIIGGVAFALERWWRRRQPGRIGSGQDDNHNGQVRLRWLDVHDREGVVDHHHRGRDHDDRGARDDCRADDHGGAGADHDEGTRSDPDGHHHDPTCSAGLHLGPTGLGRLRVDSQGGLVHGHPEEHRRDRGAVFADGEARAHGRREWVDRSGRLHSADVQGRRRFRREHRRDRPVGRIGRIRPERRGAERLSRHDDPLIERLVASSGAGGSSPAATIRRAIAAGPEAWVDPARGIGRLRAALLSEGERRSGSVYTPPEIARELVERGLETYERAATMRGTTPAWASLQVFDPSVGGGVFLLEAAEALERRGVPRSDAVRCCRGIDIDPLAVEVTRTALGWWAGRAPAAVGNVSAASALDDGAVPNGCDLIVGNPPFQGQLVAETARSRSAASDLRDRFGEAGSGYVDTAALILLACVEAVATDGVVAMIVPLSVLAARDAAAVRRRIEDEAELVGLWVAARQVFDADVRVCAPVLSGRPRAEDRPRLVRRWSGADFVELDPAERPDRDGSWSSLVADTLGVPAVSLPAHRVVGDLATATAGFRDQYYGLRGAVTESAERRPGPERPMLLTSGAVDPAWNRWGTRPVRFAKQSWSAPVVDRVTLAETTPAVHRWGERVLVPKLVVANQTRILEAVADRTGTAWPSVPTIAVVAPPETLDRLLAVLLAPPVSAWLFGQVAGAAMAVDALRLSARLLAQIPLPGDDAAWARATELLTSVVEPAADAGDRVAWSDGLAQFGEEMCAAYDADMAVAAWWHGRLPHVGVGSLPT